MGIVGGVGIVGAVGAVGGASRTGDNGSSRSGGRWWSELCIVVRGWCF